MLAATAPAASAAPWDYNNRNIDARQEQLNERIDQGVRDGSLTRREAFDLRAQARQIAYLEARYRNNGMTWDERRDLNQRLDQLAQNIRYERHDDQYRGQYRNPYRYGG
jgi:hypothetical protein